MRVLHITSWYPNSRNSKEAIFIYRQIEALTLHSAAESDVFHLSVDQGPWSYLSESSFGAKHTIVKVPFRRWFLVELLATFLLYLNLIKFKVNQYEVVNFHVAYPNLTYWHWFKRWIKPKVLISEHWSAYHFNFNLHSPPFRVQRIFDIDIPLMTVSKALREDIEKFCDKKLNGQVVPNVVDTDIFKRDDNVQRINKQFFMVAQWKLPKDPFCVLEAFNSFRVIHSDAKLIIGGYGPQLNEMKQKVSGLNIADFVEFRGKMDPEEIAKEMQRAQAYIHSSDYETFSVVCAEAISCGCPVVASRVGGIPEFINESNGVLVDYQTSYSFLEGMKMIINKKNLSITGEDFSIKTVGVRYKRLLDEIRM